MDDSMSGTIECKKPPAMIPSTASTAAAAATAEINTTATTTKSEAMTATIAAAVAAATNLVPANAAASACASAKTLKRCLSVPIIHTLPGSSGVGVAVGVCASGNGSNINTNNGNGGGAVVSSSAMTTRSAAAAAALAKANSANAIKLGSGECAHNNHNPQHNPLETPKKYQYNNTIQPDSSSTSSGGNFHTNSIHIGIPRSNPSSREVSPAPMFNIFAPRARRYSASYSPLGGAGNANASSAGAVAGAALCLTPRVSQLRQEECVDMNSREVNHEREVHSAMQMSQSWEDLTLVAENWSCKSDELSNPLQVVLPSGVTSCSSPSPTSNRANVRLPYGLSPSPTRRTFTTRRSMSPIAMRPSQLGPVKRKFELEDNSSSNWNVYSPPPLKKIFSESRGSSPVCQSPPSVCPSPDSGTYDGRSTPKLFISKLCTSNTNGNNLSACSSPISASPSNSGSCPIDSSATSGICSSSSSSSSASSVSGGSEPMCIGGNVDEGISVVETDDKGSTAVQAMSTEDEATLMDDIKSETSSIGGCSSISIESSSCDSGAKAAAHFLNKLHVDDANTVSSTMCGSSAGGGSVLGQKNFFINKQGLSGPKKFIVNHDNLPNSCSESPENSIRVSSTTATTIGVKTRRNAALRLTTTAAAAPAVAAPNSAATGANHNPNIMQSNANAIGTEMDTSLALGNKS